MIKFHLINIFLLLLFCSKQHDAIHLTYCQNNNDTTITQDSNGLGQSNISIPKTILQEPCFKDSLSDSILIKWAVPNKDSILLELLNQYENVIQIIENGSLMPGSYNFPIKNNRDNQIYGIRMIYGSYDNTIWFYEN